MKKILALALMALLILSALPARADGENLELVPPSGPVNPYGLGFETFPPKTRSSTISVITLQEPVLGSTGRWSVQSEGATEYQFSLCPYDANLSVQETNFIQRYSSDNTFSYTFYEAGQYVLFLYVKDSSGSVKRDYFYFSVADMPGAVSVSSRVSEIVAECQTNVSGEYETAVWLHDWITHNAYYDESYSNYGADGILFRSTGVCDSYSKLYKLLLTEAGIENMRVTGRADGGNHAWNAVKIDGVWCQIDVTWDDPPTGSMSFVSGKENYDYFGLNDELMSLDHSYTSPVVCDSLANYYYYRTRQHETWMYLVWDEIEDNLASGLTSFDVDTQGIIVTRVVDNGYSYRYDEWTSTVAAALMSLDPWTFQGGDSVYVMFTYNGETNTMHCEVQMADPCADGHDWGDLIIEWASDGSAVTATRVCSRDETHVETAPAAFVLAQAPTADTAGKTLYTAVFESEPCDAQAIVEDIPALSDLDVLYLPDDLTAIEDEAFMYADCEAVIIPDGCVSIGARAFAGCERLIYISIPASVTDMAEDALEDCAIVRVDVIVE